MAASQKIGNDFHALVTVNTNGRITRINSQTQAMFGYTREELLNQPIEALIPQRLHAKHGQSRNSFFAEPHLRAMDSGLELSALRKDGREFPVEIQLSPLQIGEETFVTASIRDISQRKQMDQDLHYRNNVLAALHQVTLDLVNRHEMDDILRTLLAKIGTLLDASDISFDLVENGDTLVTYAVTSDQPLKMGDVMRRGQGGWLSKRKIALERAVLAGRLQKTHVDGLLPPPPPNEKGQVIVGLLSGDIPSQMPRDPEFKSRIATLLKQLKGNKAA